MRLRDWHCTPGIKFRQCEATTFRGGTPPKQLRTHLFCTPEQVGDEFKITLGLVKYVLDAVGLEDYRVQLSTRDPDSDKYVGSEELWDNAEEILRQVLNEEGLDYVETAGEAAFYGPKADFMVKDCLGREWQLGTVQLDYNLPERFELEYIGSDNKPHRPVMIHRAPFGSMERFVGMLIEHFAGAFPVGFQGSVGILNRGRAGRGHAEGGALGVGVGGQGVEADGVETGSFEVAA